MEDRIDEVASQLASNCVDSNDDLDCLRMQIEGLRSDSRWNQSAVDAIQRRVLVLLSAAHA